MTVTWILEPDMCGAYYRNLAAEIESQGHVTLTVPDYYTTLDWADTSRFYKDFAPPGSCVVCHASFQFTNLVAEDEIWVPGTYGLCDSIDCSNYFRHFEDFLLNDDYELIRYHELRKRSDTLFKTFGVGDRIFIRPESGKKPFAGRLLTQSELEVHFSRGSNVSPDGLVVVSRPKSIRFEWRFIIADRRVIAASMYKDGDSFCVSPDVKPEAFELATILSSREFQPDRIWVLDICELTNGDVKVVEINGFSSSSWYCCNVKDVVAAVSEIAIDDWKLKSSAKKK